MATILSGMEKISLSWMQLLILFWLQIDVMNHIIVSEFTGVFPFIGDYMATFL